MGDVCDTCGERVVAAECVDYVIGYCIVSETEPKGREANEPTET